MKYQSGHWIERKFIVKHKCELPKKRKLIYAKWQCGSCDSIWELITHEEGKKSWNLLEHGNRWFAMERGDL